MVNFLYAESYFWLFLITISVAGMTILILIPLTAAAAQASIFRRKDKAWPCKQGLRDISLRPLPRRASFGGKIRPGLVNKAFDFGGKIRPGLVNKASEISRASFGRKIRPGLINKAVQLPLLAVPSFYTRLPLLACLPYLQTSSLGRYWLANQKPAQDISSPFTTLSNLTSSKFFLLHRFLSSISAKTFHPLTISTNSNAFESLPRYPLFQKGISV